MGGSCFGGWRCRRSGEKRRPNNQNINKVEDFDGCSNYSCGDSNVKILSYNSLRVATRNFDPTNRIGAGAFGVVHKGVLRDGTRVAIKSLSAESKQGTREFLTEISTISRIRHSNLVELYGCCIEGNHRILVYQFLENNSLAGVLLGSRSKHVFLDWPKRAAICKGTALGLAFLHNEADPNIVHRDIKASNILLDGNFNPKISDFGLAKLFPDNITHLSTQVAGTMGYVAPEYAFLGQLTKKADVYSFGVLMLEIISGNSSSKAAFGDDLLVLVEWTWKLKEENRLLDLVDAQLLEYPEDEVKRFLKVALFCTQAAPNLRPSMRQVVKMLSKEVHLNERALSEPGVLRIQSFRSRRNGAGASSSGVPPKTFSSSEETTRKTENQSSNLFDGETINRSGVSEMLPR